MLENVKQVFRLAWVVITLPYGVLKAYSALDNASKAAAGRNDSKDGDKDHAG